MHYSIMLIMIMHYALHGSIKVRFLHFTFFMYFATLTKYISTLQQNKVSLLMVALPIMLDRFDGIYISLSLRLNPHFSFALKLKCNILRLISAFL